MILRMIALILAAGLMTSLIVTDFNVIDLSKACTFLKSQYIPEAGLLKAAVRPGYDDAYIIYINDNVLAVNALKVCRSPLADRISSILANNYSQLVAKLKRYHFFEGKIMDNVPKDYVNVDLGTIESDNTNYSIIAKIPEDYALPVDYEKYVDWLLIATANHILKQDYITAMKYFEKAMQKWDGNGFIDEAFDGRYETYKLGLAIYVWKSLNINNYSEEINRMLQILSKSQDPETGGIFTHYKVVNNNIIFNETISDVNVETTSIVIIALYGNEASQQSCIYFVAIIAIVIIIAALWYVIKYRRK